MISLAAALRSLSVEESSAPYLIAFDTEGAKRSGGLREIGAVAVEEDSATFYEVITQRGKAEGLAPADAARTWGTVGPRFVAWVRAVTPRGRVPLLVGHNIARHDLPLLRAESEDLWWEGFLWADTLEATRRSLPELKKRDQASVYKHLFGAEPPRHCTHTALADARAAAAIASEMSEVLVGLAKPFKKS
jgi:hypothetical protein